MILAAGHQRREVYEHGRSIRSIRPPVPRPQPTLADLFLAADDAERIAAARLLGSERLLALAIEAEQSTDNIGDSQMTEVSNGTTCRVVQDYGNILDMQENTRRRKVRPRQGLHGLHASNGRERSRHSTIGLQTSPGREVRVSLPH
jgi:hypothetical protein